MSGKLLRAFLRMMLAYYISGLGYIWLVDGEWSLKTVLKVILLMRAAGFSEFLLSFAFLYLLVWLFHKQLKMLLQKKWRISIGVIVSLMAVFLPSQYVKWPSVAVLLGSADFASFPLLHYGGYFLLGAGFAKDKTGAKGTVWAGSLVGAIGFSIFCIKNGSLPGRFPPTLLWLAGGFFFVYVYYNLSRILVKCRLVQLLHINDIGRHTLIYLVVSNFIMFLFRRYEIVCIIQNRLAFYVLIDVIIFTACFGVSRISGRIKESVVS